MTRGRKISIMLQIGLILTLFLPFFKSCIAEKSEADEAIDEQSDEKVYESDTLIKKSVTEKDILSIDSLEAEIQNSNEEDSIKNDGELSERLSNKSKILKTLLRPNNNYTGIATILDLFSLLKFGYGLGLAFVLWIISLVIKLKDFNNIFLLINTIGIVLLCFSNSINFFASNEKLWGFWVCLAWGTSMMIYDFLFIKGLNRLSE